MNRKLTIAGILLGLFVAVVVVVIATQQPAQEKASRSGFTLTTNNELVVESKHPPTIIAHFPKTNSTPVKSN